MDGNAILLYEAICYSRQRYSRYSQSDMHTHRRCVSLRRQNYTTTKNKRFF
jgi:hypothetical protein